MTPGGFLASLGFRSEPGFTRFSDQKSRNYVRWLGLIFGPVHFGLYFVDRLGSSEVDSIHARLISIIGLLVPSLITFLPGNRIRNLPYRDLWLFHVIVWLIGQNILLQIYGGQPVAIFTLSLIILAAGMLSYYEPWKLALVSIANVIAYILIMGDVGKPPFQAPLLGATSQMIVSSLMAICLSVLGWRRSSREFHFSSLAEKQRGELEMNHRQVEKEMALAEKIQRRLLPRRHNDDRVETDYIYLPFKNVGGDMVEIVPLGEGKIGLMVADVTGHGIPAALISSMFKVHLFSSTREMLLNPSRLIETVNRNVSNMLSSQFITLIYCVLDTRTGKVDYSLAGHDVPAIVRSGGGITTGSLRNPAIGLDRNSSFESAAMTMNPGDLLFLYTDGCYEFRTRDSVSDLKSFHDILEQMSAEDFSRIMPRMTHKILENKNKSDLKDDISLLVCRIKPS